MKKIELYFEHPMKYSVPKECRYKNISVVKEINFKLVGNIKTYKILYKKKILSAKFRVKTNPKPGIGKGSRTEGDA